MYKLASRNLQRAHRVDKPKPTGGYIGGAAFDHDFIPSAANMSRDEVEEERRQLIAELTRAENQLLASKQANDQSAVVGLGHRIQGYVQRLALLKQRLKTLNDERECELLSTAIKDLCDPDLAEAIFGRVTELRDGTNRLQNSYAP